MRKTYLILFALFFVEIALSQVPTISKEMPTVIPPAPTAAGLMKFEETPVSNYTGIPDVTLPLFSSPTYSKDIGLDISLKYHPAGIKVEDVAGDVGLGWSLFAGGTVSRTVMDIPDELYRLPFSGNLIPDKGKFGIYRNNQTYHKNLTYKLLQLAKGNPNVVVTDEEKRQFLWETFLQGQFDTDHDIWSYNFMGHSGSFIIEKNFETNLLEVKKLKLDDNLKIVNIYDSNSFAPTSFEIYDDKGYKFIFDAVEESKTDSFTDIVYQSFDYSGSLDYFLNRPIEYISSFRLTKVIDNNNKPLINIKYNDDDEIIYEKTLSTSYEYNEGLQYNSVQTVLDYIRNCDPENNSMQNQKLEPKSTTNFMTNSTKVKKIKRIEVVGISKFEFEYDNERLDFSDTTFSSAKLISITKRDTINNNIIGKVTLDYFYNDLNFFNRKKLFLNSVKTYNNDQTESLNQTFEYDFPDINIDRNTLGIDYWGYHTKINRLEPRYTRKAATADYCRIGILKKIIYPTKGATIFDYETNRFSYLGNNLIDNFDNNPLNWEDKTKDKTFNTLDEQLPLFTILDAQNIYVNYTLDSNVQGLSDYRFNIFKKNLNGVFVWIKSVEPGACATAECESSFSLEPGEYNVSFSSVILNFPQTFTVSAHFEYKEKYPIQKQFLLGGGNRIKRITYLTDSNEENENNIAKEVNYEYTMAPEEHANQSSGSLAFGIPQFQYNKDKLCHIYVTGTATTHPLPGDPTNPITYTNVVCSGVPNVSYKTTSSNNLSFNFQTNGSDVGYKYVKVFESGNGSILYKYDSPINFPEDDFAYSTTYPFYPSENNDYKRGNLIFQKTFDQTNKLLDFTENNYEYVEVDDKDKIFGLKIIQIGENCPFNYMATTYANFAATILNSTGLYSCKDPILNYFPYVLKRNIGWAKLRTKTSEQYFYPNGSSIPNIVRTYETYDYSPINKRISESTITNSKGEVLKTNYFYHTGNSPTSQNRISEIERIETSNGSELLSTSKIVYSNTFAGNSSYLPQTIQAAKGYQALEDRLRYNAYDEYGHPLEVQKENGTVISYIWGYNNSQPIAKLENRAYSSISSTVISHLKSLSDDDNDHCTSFPCSGNEENLRVELNNLRTQFPEALITTYTYDPLRGVTSITDPKGYVTYYEYDSFGRLKEVKDDDGNTLSENEYHYRTQN